MLQPRFVAAKQQAITGAALLAHDEVLRTAIEGMGVICSAVRVTVCDPQFICRGSETYWSSPVKSENVLPKCC
jgi:hypothetical protein